MESYRTPYEHETAHNKIIVKKDIIELGEKITAFKEGKIPEEKFRALRLARGVYGQRQQGVQMIRIKLPYGKVTASQLQRIAAVSDEYSTGKLHITTRQDIQIHHVSLDRTPQLWEDLEKDDVTLREACGNTVRNVTASDNAGINQNELFDVTPYADQVFRYFLRKPFGQELGRKIKIAFSSDDSDDAFTFIHDFGFIPRVQEIDNKQLKGFKVLVGGGLGAQPFLAHVAFEFLPATEIISFIEASIRVFDRYGERNSRNKARMKYLISKVGFETFMELVEQERIAVQYDPGIDALVVEEETFVPNTLEKPILFNDNPVFNFWVETNVFPQKQNGFFAVYVKVPLGDFSSDQARKLAALMDDLNIPELRFTIDQNIQFRYVTPDKVNTIFQLLEDIGLSQAGYKGLSDVTACPGTDTCNLGISNSTQVALEIESYIQSEYPDLSREREIQIKISGCMNSCAQHGLAHIGFHGSSIKTKEGTLPALQVLIGGGRTGGGTGRIAEKVIKIPSRRILKVLQFILDDYLQFHDNDESFNTYYDRRGNNHFYQLLKPLADVETVDPGEYIDWGGEERFKTEIGIGECAGVVIDLVGTLLFDAEEKLENALTAYRESRFSDALYFSYSAGIHAAKAALINSDVRCNTHQGIIQDFESKLARSFGYEEQEFTKLILTIQHEKPSELLVKRHIEQISQLIEKIRNTKKETA